MSPMTTVELSIVIPLFNEERALPHLFKSLERQKDICCEVIFCDGGSQDGSLELLNGYANRSHHQIKVVSTERGRGRQMNQGAEIASCSRLLFLHADSVCRCSSFLRAALNDFRAAEKRCAPVPIAAHFTLQFGGCHSDGRFYQYLSEKSHLNRQGTIYGDQGMLMSKRLWLQVGGFSTSQPILEDVLFADAVMEHGKWILLPQQIETSNRRYQEEGCIRRAVKNGLLLIVAGTGFTSLLSSTSILGSYHHAPCSGSKLSSSAVSLHRMTLTSYVSFWYGCGRGVAQHFWIVVFAASWGVPWLTGTQRRALLDRYDRYGATLLLHPFSYTFFAVLSWFVFYLTYLCLPLNWLVQCRDEQH